MRNRSGSSSVVVMLLVAGILASPRSAVSLAGASASAAELGPAPATAGRSDKCPVEPQPINLLSPDDSSIEPTVGSWSVTGADAAASAERFFAGAASLGVSATEAGDMVAQTGPDSAEVTAGKRYTGQARIARSGASREVAATLSWYGAAGELISTTPGGALEQKRAEDGDGWTWVTTSGGAPAGATSASLGISVRGAEAGETHYVDTAMVEQSALPSGWVLGTSGVAPEPEDCEEPPPDDGGNGGDDNDGNGNGGNGNGGNGNGGNGNGGNGNGGNGNGGNGNGGNHPDGSNPGGSAGTGSKDRDDTDGPGRAGRGNGSKSTGARGSGNASPDKGSAAPSGPEAGAGGYQPTGSYSAESLMSAAVRLRSLGWSSERIAKKVFSPFIIAGESGFINTWGAPRSGGRSHEGQDVFCNYGAPVLAPESGTIEFGEGGLGGRVARLHRPDGSYWYYAHLSDWNTADFASGDSVSTGEVIGYCGNTGNAITTPPHVHFGWYLANGEAANPMAMLVKWLHAAEKRTLGYVTSAEFEQEARVDELTSARHFGDAFTFDPAASEGDFPSPLMFTGPLRLALALQESLAAHEGTLVVNREGSAMADPEMLHFEAWLSSGTGPVAVDGADSLVGSGFAD